MVKLPDLFMTSLLEILPLKKSFKEMIIKYFMKSDILIWRMTGLIQDFHNVFRVQIYPDIGLKYFSNN